MAEPHDAVAVPRSLDDRLEVERGIRLAFWNAAHEPDDDLVVDRVDGVGDYAGEVDEGFLRILAPRGADADAVDIGIGEDGGLQVLAGELDAVFFAEAGDAVVAEAGKVDRRMVRHLEIVVYPDDRWP